MNDEALNAHADSRPKVSSRERRFIVRGLARGLGLAVAVTALYFVVPLDKIANLPFAVFLVFGLLTLAGVTVYEVREILRSGYPLVRGIEAVAFAVPLFLVLFATLYYLLSASDASSFSAPLTRMDALYFTVTVFATVGFGDISGATQFARGLVTVQMVLDLIILGAVIKVFTTAVKVARRGPDPASRDGASAAPAEPGQ